MPWVLAIDFGTSSTAAAMGRDGGAQPVAVDGGLPRMLSNVFWHEETGRLLLGDVADNASAIAPWCFERSPKRRLGQEHLLLGDQQVRVADAVGAVLANVAEEAVRLQGRERPHAVRLTHPVRWGVGRRQALLEAAAAAGLEQPELVLEPVAAAMHYAQERLAEGEFVAVYDLGGGTFDTAVLQRTGGGFEVVGVPGGRDGFGGEEFDDRLYRFLGEQLPEEDWVRLRSEAQAGSNNEWPKANRQFQRNVRRAKELLTNNPAGVTVVVPSPVNRDLILTAEDLNGLIRRDVEDSVNELKRTVVSAGLDPGQLSAVYLAGGSSQIPLVATLIDDGLGIVPEHLNDPKAVISLGAATGIAGTPDDHGRAARERSEREQADRERARQAERARAEREQAHQAEPAEPREQAEQAEREQRDQSERDRVAREAALAAERRPVADPISDRGERSNTGLATRVRSAMAAPAPIATAVGCLAVVVAPFLHYFGGLSAWRYAPTRFPAGITIMALLVVALVAAGRLLGRRVLLFAAVAVALVLLGESFWLTLRTSYTPIPTRQGAGFWLGALGALVACIGAVLVAREAVRARGGRTAGPRGPALSFRARAIIAGAGPVIVIGSMFLHYGAQLSAWQIPPTRYPVVTTFLCLLAVSLAILGLRRGRRTLLLVAAAIPFLVIGETLPLWYPTYHGLEIGFAVGGIGAVLAAVGGIYVAATAPPKDEAAPA